MSATNEVVLVRLLQQLNEAALSAPSWEPALKTLCESLGSLRATLCVFDEHGRRCAACVSWCNETATLGHCCDRRSEEGCALLTALLSGGERSALASPRGLSVTELWREGSRRAFLLLSRLSNHTGAPAAPVDSTVLAPLLPFLRHSFQTALRVDSGERRNTMLTETLEHSPVGVLLLDDLGRAEYVNPAAQGILDQADGLQLDPDRRLRAVREAEDRALRALVESALQPGAGRSGRGYLSVSRSSGRPPFCLALAPISHGRSALGTEHRGVRLFVSDPIARRDISAERLQQLFRLTPKEALLAEQLTHGATLAEAASAVGIAEKTARIHLQGLFRKTATRRQVDLLRVLLASSGLRASAPEGDA